jgi:Tfp pilus assembly protein PilO
MKAWLQENMTFNQQRLILVCVSVVMTAAVAMYLLLPSYRAQQAVAQQARNLEVQLNSTQIPVSEMIRLQSDIDQYSISLTQQQLAASGQEAETELLRHLHTTAQAQNLELVRIQPARAQAAETVQELRFEIEILGGYMATARWLETLDSGINNTLLHSFEMDTGNSNGKAIRTSVTLLAYQVMPS